MEKQSHILPEGPRLTILRNMEIGEEVRFPLEERATIRTYCCEFGLQWKKKFETKTDRLTRQVIVKRVL